MKEGRLTEINGAEGPFQAATGLCRATGTAGLKLIVTGWGRCSWMILPRRPIGCERAASLGRGVRVLRHDPQSGPPGRHP